MGVNLRKMFRGQALNALCLAAEKGDVDAVLKIMRKHPIDPFEVPGNGKAAFLLAARQGHAEVVKALVEDERFDPLRYAFHGPEYWFRKNRPDVARLLLECPKVNADATNANGETLLHQAARQGRLRWTRMLLAHANPDARDRHGRTALHLAAESDHRLVPALLEKGSNPNLKDAGGRTPLHCASSSARPEVLAELVDLLCSKGADPNIGDGVGTLAVAHCVQRDHMQATRVLLRRGASANDAIAAGAQAVRRGGAAVGMTAIECINWGLSRTGDLLHVAVQAKPAASMRPFEALALMEFMRRNRLVLAPHLRLVELSGVPTLLNKECLHACIRHSPAAFGIGTRFPSSRAALEAICAGSIPWDLFNNESEEHCIVTGTLLGFGEENARRYFESWRKNGYARREDFVPHAMFDEFMRYKSTFPWEDVGWIHPPGVGLLATDSVQTREMLRSFRRVTDELNAQLNARYLAERAENPQISRVETRARLMTEVLFRPLCTAADPT